MQVVFDCNFNPLVKQFYAQTVILFSQDQRQKQSSDKYKPSGGTGPTKRSLLTLGVEASAIQFDQQTLTVTDKPMGG